MRFSSSKTCALAALAGAIILALGAGCTVKHQTEERLPFPNIASIPQTSLPPAKSSDTWLTDLYPPTQGLTACQWLAAATRPVGLEERFQLLGKSDVSIQAVKDSGDKSSPPSGYLLNVSGTVDSGGSPLYSYALLSQTIPSRREFLALVKQEIEKTPGIPLKLMLGEWLMKMGWMDAYKQRNTIIEQKINEALPGIFAPEDKLFKIRDSIPWMILMNGSPELARSTTIASSVTGALKAEDELARLKAQQLAHQRALESYAKSVPVFSGTTWQTVSDDFREGLSTALRAFKTRDPEQKACATTILHRTLSQLFMIIGYDRLPFEVRKEGDGFYLPALPQLLDSETGVRFMVCPTAGSFVQEGHRVIIDRDALTAFNPDETLYDLSAGPQTLRVCNRRDAVPYNFDLHKGFRDEPVAHLAQGSDWLALINSFAQFLTAFNPAAPWWNDAENSIGFPMAPFESLERIRGSGAILPTDANALSLGLLNLSLATFLKRHLLFLDDQNQIVSDLALATKIRVSEKPYQPSDPLVQTTVESAVQLAETAFKLGETLKTLSTWFARAEAEHEKDMTRETDAAKRSALRNDYLSFMEGMYGSLQTIRDLTAQGPGTLRDKVESLKLASAFLLAEFAEKSSETGLFACSARLDLDIATGTELKRGSCSPHASRLWKYTLRLVAAEYRSPHFATLAE